MTPKISVCIPSYNRSCFLQDLLDSIISQSYQDYEIVICEDMSKERNVIRKIVLNYQQRNPGLIRYFENEINLGFDANLRNLFNKALGDYCFIMGNDDLMCVDALAVVARALEKYPNVGVILRSYASFVDSADNVNQIHRYFSDERFFVAGRETVVTFFYRLVVMSGIVLKRDGALKYNSEQFDGSLFYQMHLAANILLDMNGVFLPNILTLIRLGQEPEFGNSESEQGLFTPGSHAPDMDIRMLGGILKIARQTEISRQVMIYKPILKDIGNYSFATLAFHSNLSFNDFFRYYLRLCQAGLWNNLFFHSYFFAILILGPDIIKKFVRFLRKKIGHTPTIGQIYTGRSCQNK